MPRHARRPRTRRGAALVEFAVLLPLLAFLFLIAVDYARVYYKSLTLTNCAHHGALYGSRDPEHAADAAGIEAAALRDATNLSPTPTVSSTTGSDAAGHPYVEVTVTGKFDTITRFPGIPNSVTLSRTVRMRVAPLIPKNS